MHDTFQWEKAASLEDLPPLLRDIADRIGMETVLELVKREGGSCLYLPKADSIARKVRDRYIREEYDGYNHKHLARKYNLSEVRIRSIINETTEGTIT